MLHCTAVQPGDVKGISQYKGLPADAFRQGLIRYGHRRSVTTRGRNAYKTASHSKAGTHVMPRCDEVCHATWGGGGGGGRQGRHDMLV